MARKLLQPRCFAQQRQKKRSGWRRPFMRVTLPKVEPEKQSFETLGSKVVVAARERSHNSAVPARTPALLPLTQVLERALA